MGEGLQQPPHPPPGARRYVHLVLEIQGRESDVGRIVNGLIMVLILINVIAIVLESVPAYQARYATVFELIELVSVALFSVEYGLRVWSCVEASEFGTGWRGRLRYMLTPMALIDLIAILPFYLGLAYDVDTRILRILRLLRVFKLSRQFTMLTVLGHVLRNEAQVLGSAIFVMIILVVIAAAGMHVLEHNAQPEAFGTIPNAIWWAAATLTTVGYGDVVPVTTAGRALGVVITILGVGMAALPAGIIASGFTTELARRRERYEVLVKELGADGEIDMNDTRALVRARNELGLDRSDAKQLLRKAVIEQGLPSTHAAAERAATHPKVCPQCGHPLD